jgi:DNA-binding NtrC family response regulator
MPVDLQSVPDLPRGRPGGAGKMAREATRGKNAAATLLVVEDELLIRMTLVLYLRDAGFRVLEATSRREAQAAVEGERVALVIADVDLQGAIDGLTLCQWIELDYPEVPVILTSGLSEMDRTASEFCPNFPFLPKPLAYEALLGQIDRLLSPGQGGPSQGQR